MDADQSNLTSSSHGSNHFSRIRAKGSNDSYYLLVIVEKLRHETDPCFGHDIAAPISFNQLQAVVPQHIRPVVDVVHCKLGSWENVRSVSDGWIERGHWVRVGEYREEIQLVFSGMLFSCTQI